MQRYNPKDIEPKWQKIWDETGVYTTNLHSDKPKYIAMSMFNYPSGNLHIGHAMNYTISDVKARFKRQQGYESYHPVGWDSFGLPAENRAIKQGISPQESMGQLIPEYHRHYKAMGWSNDWEKEIATHLPEYYKWTQWIFTQMYKHGLAYQDSRMQWWCEKDNTVLANEQVIDGKCWRHDGPDDPLVEKKEIKQWFFNITDYADELLEATESLDWTESVKLAQKNWIGKSKGAEIDFALDGSDEKIKVFTTRPDTIFGATFLVVAPEHELLENMELGDEVKAYIEASQRKTELERMEGKGGKTGVFSGVYAINPANNEKIPVWVADYVLAGYGTGAIMAVPAHDERDNDFAKKYNLSIKEVIEPETGHPQENPEFRKSIVAIVYNPKIDKYLSINWGKQGGNLFIGGGREQDEDALEAAIREIAEESGYANVKLLGETGAIHHNYFAHSKNVARRIEARSFLFELIDESQTQTSLEADEEGKFTLEWLSKPEVETKIADELHATSFDLLVNQQCYKGEGVMVHSGEYDGMNSAEAREKIVADLAAKGVATEKVNYKMRDWSVSRQRYWGAPIPIVHCEKCGPQLVPDEQLPVVLPELTDFKPAGDGRSALARAKDWLNVECPQCGGPAERETDTLDTYICSSWYMYRYFDPHNQEKIFDSEIVKKWEPIDFYNGADHATAHLLYARFIGHFFKNIGLVDEPEPFKQFVFNGKVTAQDGTMFSKSKGNGVDPLDIIEQGYGADALRTYLMFAAPLDIWVRWDPQGVPGTYRFLSRLWNITQEYLETDATEISEQTQKDIRRSVHEMIKKATIDLEENRYNTAIAAVMKCLNDLYKLKTKEFGKSDVWQEALEACVACIAPFAPHITDELWQQLGHSSSVHRDSWPKYDEKHLASETVTIVVQVNGKVRANLQMPKDATEDAIVEAAKAEATVKAHLSGEPKRVIYIPNKLLNFVV